MLFEDRGYRIARVVVIRNFFNERNKEGGRVTRLINLRIVYVHLITFSI